MAGAFSVLKLHEKSASKGRFILKPLLGCFHNFRSAANRLRSRDSQVFVKPKQPPPLFSSSVTPYTYSPKTEIIFSLRTKEIRLARERCRLEAVKFDQEFSAKRRELAEQQRQQAQGAANAACLAPALRPFASVSEEEVRRLIVLYARDALTEDLHITESDKAEARREWEDNQALMLELHTKKGLPFTPEPFPETRGRSTEAVERRKANARLFLESAPLFLAEGNYAIILPNVEIYLQKNGIQAPLAAADDGTEAAQTAAKFREFCLAIMREEVTVQENILRRYGDDWNEAVKTYSFTAPLHSVEQKTVVTESSMSSELIPSEDNPLFTTVWEKYLSECRPSEGTIRNYKPAIRRFIELVGDMPIRSVTKAHIRRFKDALLETPAYLSSEMKSMPFSKLLKFVAKDKDAYRYLNPKTINDKNISPVSAVCTLAVANGYIDNNPCTGIRATEQQNVDSVPSVLPYSGEDLKIIFQKSRLFHPNGKETISACGTLPRQGGRQHIIECRWFVLLALFSGARIEELGQLDIVDVKEEAGVKYIHIHADAETGRTVKNKASRRKTPIHPRLLELGFMDFVEHVKATGATKIFSTFRQTSIGKRTSAFSHWWERFTTEIGVKKEDKRKRFHSFRHCFKREMVNTMSVSTELIDALQGHTAQGVSAQYGRDEDGMQYALPTLFEAISKATFGGVTEGLDDVMRS